MPTSPAPQQHNLFSPRIFRGGVRRLPYHGSLNQSINKSSEPQFEAMDITLLMTYRQREKNPLAADSPFLTVNSVPALAAFLLE